MRHVLTVMVAGVLLIPATAKAEPQSWSRVRHIAAGTEVSVERHGLDPLVGVVLAADDVVLRLMRVDTLTATGSEVEALREVAIAHPEYFIQAGPGRTFSTPNVLVTGGEIQVRGRRIGALDEIVVDVPRDLVARVESTASLGNPAGCAAVGYFRGGLLGALPGALIGGAIGRDSGPALAGLMVGWAVVGIRSYASCRHVRARVIYTS